MPHACRLRTLWIALTASVLGTSTLAAPNSVWLEAEDYAECNFTHFEKSSMGKPELLSGGEWIMRGVGTDEVAKPVPGEEHLQNRSSSLPRPARRQSADGPAPPADVAEPTAPAGTAAEDEPEDHYREAASDPVIRDLISRGGKITDVQLLTEE